MSEEKYKEEKKGPWLKYKIIDKNKEEEKIYTGKRANIKGS